MFIFEKIEERDMDLVIMRAIAASPEFANLFLKPIGWTDAKVIRVEHSLTDPQWGESDITVVVEKGNSRLGLLIENKIDAAAMPDQCLRYQKRGEIGVNGGQYDDYEIYITAPQSYLNTNAEAQKYPHHLSYETMLNCFERLGSEFDCAVVRSAIKKKEHGYTVHEAPAITQFWQKLYAYTQTNEPRVSMYPPTGAKGSRSAWPQFKTSLQGTSLYFKSGQGAVDLEFSGKLDESVRLKSEINIYKDDDMHWENTGRSLSLRIQVKGMNFNDPFEQYTDDIDLMLSAVHRLSSLATKLNDIGFLL